jgi:transposase
VDTYPLGDTGPRKEEFIVPRTRPAYPPEFRRQIVELVRAGRTPEDLAREFEPSAQTIRSWANQDRVDAGERPGLTSDEREELAQLRREVKQLREEKEILRKATVFFVRETSR